jgi:hypothetical protein
MRVKVLQGPLQAQIGLLAALRPHERVLVRLQLLGGQQQGGTGEERDRGDWVSFRRLRQRDCRTITIYEQTLV